MQLVRKSTSILPVILVVVLPCSHRVSSIRTHGLCAIRSGNNGPGALMARDPREGNIGEAGGVPSSTPA